LAKDVDGIDSMFTLIQGMFHKNRLRDIIRNFIYIPDSSKKNEKLFVAIRNTMLQEPCMTI
jgi:type I restriction enzyme R subunit